MPPINLAAAALAAALLAWRRLALAALALLLLLALPAVAVPLLVALEVAPTMTPPAAAGAGAIVILGGDATPGDDLGQSDVGYLTLQRLRGGAALARATGLPILVTGGVVSTRGDPVAVLMARSLAADFATPARWVEPEAATTWENAALSAAMLRREGIGTVLVVTHAWHMRRALIAFRAAGLQVRPAPLPADHMPHFEAADFVPRVGDWQRSYFALHEWIGCLWYALLAA